MVAGMDMPPHARAVAAARGHRFAAYPRCSADPVDRRHGRGRSDWRAVESECDRAVASERMMTFDLRIITVGYDEWTLWASLAISTIVAVPLGAEVGKRVARVRITWLRWLIGAVTLGALWFGMGVGSLLAFGLLFMVANGGASVCTVLVGRALQIPSFAVVASEAFGWWRLQRAEDRRGRRTRG
jgi:hypothetical protein